MALSEKEIVNIILNQSVLLEESGIDNFPGGLMILDQDPIYIPEERCMTLYAWYEKNEPDEAKSYIIGIGLKFIFIDNHYWATDVYNYYLNKSKNNA